MGEPGELLSMGSHRVRDDWSDLAAAAAVCSYKKRRQTDRENITWRHRCTERRWSCDEGCRDWSSGTWMARFRGGEILSRDVSTRGDYNSATTGFKKLRTLITFKMTATGNEREFVQAQIEGFLTQHWESSWTGYCISGSTDLQTAMMEKQMNGLTKRLTRVEKHVVYEWSWEKAKGRVVNPHSYYY